MPSKASSMQWMVDWDISYIVHTTQHIQEWYRWWHGQPDLSASLFRRGRAIVLFTPLISSHLIS